MKINTIFVHPVKGLTAQVCDRVQLVENFGILGDRAFALMFTDMGDAQPLTPWLSKKHFAVQNDWGQLASLNCAYDTTSQTLEITKNGELLAAANLGTETGRDRISAFFSEYLHSLTPSTSARHPQYSPVRLVGTTTGDTRYQDRDQGQISIISQATLDDIAEKVGVNYIDPRRFRANFIVDNIPAWSEFNWVGNRLKLGSALVEVTAPIGRCLNIDVNPDTGDRDISLLSQLSAKFGHAQTGVIAKVITGAVVTTGETLAIK